MSPTEKLVYLSQWTRPDIAHAVSVVSKFNNNVGKTHWTPVKIIFCYLKGTLEYKLVYRWSLSKVVIEYCDSDWDSDTDDSKLYAGYVFILGNSLLSWNLKKKTTNRSWIYGFYSPHKRGNLSTTSIGRTTYDNHYKAH